MLEPRFARLRRRRAAPSNTARIVLLELACKAGGTRQGAARGREQHCSSASQRVGIRVHRWWSSLNNERIATSGTSSGEVREQGLRVTQIGSVEALGEGAIDLRQQPVSLLSLALLLPQAAQAHHRAQ